MTTEAPPAAETPPAAAGPVEFVEIKRRLGTLRFHTDSPDHAHITTRPEICAKCPHSFCTFVCPAQ